MTTKQIHDSREAFEKAFPDEDLIRYEGMGFLGDYVKPRTRCMLRAWQACEAQHKQKVREFRRSLSYKCSRPDDFLRNTLVVSLESIDMEIRQHFGVEGV